MKSRDELRKLAEAASLGPWEADCFLITSAANKNTRNALQIAHLGIHGEHRLKPEQSEKNAAYIVAACNAVPDLLEEIVQLRAEVEQSKRDAERIDFLSSMIRSENIDLGIAIYAGSKIIDTVCKEFVWVSNFSDTNSDIECFDDIGEGKTLREAIDAAIAAEKDQS